MNKERISKKMKDFYPLNKEGFTPPINWQDWDFIITSLETLEEVREYCEPHKDKMWASVILGILNGTDFRGEPILNKGEK